MGITALDRAVHGYIGNSLAPATRAAYRSAANRYAAFCNPLGITPFPLQISTVLRFVAYLAENGMSITSLLVYLSGIRFTQIAAGLPDPGLSSSPWLHYVLRGVYRSQGPRAPNCRLPITPEILQTLHTYWSNQSVMAYYDRAMLWAACCLGFFGFLRSGEFTCPSRATFHDNMLSPRDITVDSRQSPTMVAARLRRSKADPFGRGVTIHLGRTGQVICPVSAVLAYMTLRGQEHGPLFIFLDGSSLSKRRLIHAVHEALNASGADPAALAQLTGHSFRIGAATTAARVGMEDSLIQTLGRWRSSAYQRYIRTPGSTLASVSARLLVPVHPQDS